MLTSNKYHVFIGGLTFAVLTVLTWLTLKYVHFSAFIETTIDFGLMAGSPLLWLFMIVDRANHSQYWIIFYTLSFSIYGCIYGYFIGKKQPKYQHKSLTVRGEPVEPPFDKLRANGKYKQTFVYVLNIRQFIIKLCILFLVTLIGLSTIAVSLFLFSDIKIS